MAILVSETDRVSSIDTTRVSHYEARTDPHGNCCLVWYQGGTAPAVRLNPTECDRLLESCFKVSECHAQEGTCYQKFETLQPRPKCAGCNLMFCLKEAGHGDRRQAEKHAPPRRVAIYLCIVLFLVVIIQAMANHNLYEQVQVLQERGKNNGNVR